MPMYVCRWPDGDCSFVSARSKAEAIERLDEVSNAEGCPLEAFPDFLVHLHLEDDGRVTLSGFGDRMEGIWEFLYPLLWQALGDEASPERVRDAVGAERHRIQAKDGPAPETGRGRELKEMTAMPTSMVNRIVRRAGRKILDETTIPPKNRRH